MKFEFGPGQKKLIIGLIFLVVLVTIVVVVFRRRAKYVFPIAAGDTSNEGGILTTAIAACTTYYRTALQQGSSDSTPPKNVCIQNAVNTYFSAKCPFVVNGTAPSSTSIPPASQTALDAYSKYIGVAQTGASPTLSVTAGGESGAVTGSSGYISLGMGTLPNSLTSDIVTRARKADLTGPTRKYIATACPNFYTPADGSTDFSDTVYKTWSSGNPPTPTGTVTYGFNGSLVNGPKVYEWAIKAGKAITVTTGIAAADTAAGVTSTTTKTIIVDNAVTIATNTKVKLSGIGGIFTASTSGSSTTITLSYDAAGTGGNPGFPAIPVGTTINKYTGSAISTAAGSALPYTSTSATTSLTLTLASALDDSIVAGAGTTGSQVLISGAQITGAVYVTNIAADNSGNSRRSVTIGFTSSQTPAIPLGATIENILDIPYATPLVTTNLPMYVTADKAATGSSIPIPSVFLGTGSISSTVSFGTSPGVVVTMPTVGQIGVSGSVIKAYISTAVPAGGKTGTITLTYYASASAASAGTSSPITWPLIPAGTVIFDANGMPFITASANDLYTKMGTLAGQKMANWQISQTNGPGTVWTDTAATPPNRIQWAYT